MIQVVDFLPAVNSSADNLVQKSENVPIFHKLAPLMLKLFGFVKKSFQSTPKNENFGTYVEQFFVGSIKLLDVFVCHPVYAVNSVFCESNRAVTQDKKLDMQVHFQFENCNGQFYFEKDKHVLVNKTSGILSSETCMSLIGMRNQNKKSWISC